jgi:hypothetical protein
MFQGWWHTTATDVYTRSAVKTGPLLASCGWADTDKYMCWWEPEQESERDTIPASLLDMVLPGLDNVAALAAERYNTYGLDFSAVRVTQTLQYLRRVFLEDAVYKRPLYPDFPAYRHEVFMDPTTSQGARRCVERTGSQPRAGRCSYQGNG